MGVRSGRAAGVHDRASIADDDIRMWAGIYAIGVCRGFRDAEKAMIVGGWHFDAGLGWALERLWMHQMAWMVWKATECNSCRAFL